MKRKSVLVIGASSLVGRRLWEVFSQAPMLARFQAQFSSRWRRQCQTLCLDLARPQNFKPDTSFDAAIICSPIWLLSEAAIVRLREIGVKRLIVFSSTSRFTKTGSDEDAERKVAQSLIDGEARVEAVCTREKIAWTILRPTLIFDEGRDQNISQIVRFIDKLGLFVVCGRAKGLRQPVHARDLAIAAVQALQSPKAQNKAYNLSGGETLTYRAMVERIFEARGHKPRVYGLPGIFWQTGFALMNLIRPKHKLKLNVQMALRMNTDLVFDHSQATRDFGYAPTAFALSSFTTAGAGGDCPAMETAAAPRTRIRSRTKAADVQKLEDGLPV